MMKLNKYTNRGDDDGVIVGKTRDDDAKDDKTQAKTEATQDAHGHLESEPSGACDGRRVTTRMISG